MYSFIINSVVVISISIITIIITSQLSMSPSPESSTQMTVHATTLKIRRKCGRPRNPIPRHKRESHISAEYRRRDKIQALHSSVLPLTPPPLPPPAPLVSRTFQLCLSIHASFRPFINSLPLWSYLSQSSSANSLDILCKLPRPSQSHPRASLYLTISVFYIPQSSSVSLWI